MRLINARTLELEEFMGEEIPAFYILSHRWSEDEVTYKDFLKKRRRNSLGYKKIVECCRFIRRQHDKTPGNAGNPQPWETGTDDLNFYVWIDTCCIDKSSSAELSEAINSMYSYYRDAGICLAYLSDVSTGYAEPMFGRAPQTLAEQFAASAWFRRGWTLQELLAPNRVVFVDHQWRVIGQKGCSLTKSSTLHRRLFSCDSYFKAPKLEKDIAKITGIDETYLHTPSAIQHASIAARMSWMARRYTLRIEDMAYSLLGIFDVNMPLLYGEGVKAFRRLQEELLRTSNDQSIFAWWPTPADLASLEGRYRYLKTGILAPSPKHFEHSANIYRVSRSPQRNRPYAMTNLGLELQETFRRVKLKGMEQDLVYLMPLNCARNQSIPYLIDLAIWHVRPRADHDGGFVRVFGVRERFLEDAVVAEGNEGEHGDEDEQRLLYVKPVDYLFPISLIANGEKSDS